MIEESSNAISYLVTALLFFIPFGIEWYLLFRLIRKDLKTTLSISFLISCTIVAVIAYVGVCMAIFSEVGGQFSQIVMGVGYIAVISSSFLLFPSIFITIIFFILHRIKREHK